MSRTPPSTPALRVLRARGVEVVLHPYRYVPRGGTRVSARALGVDEHAVIKTLVLRDEDGAPLLMLMHGDREVSLKALARARGARVIEPCTEAEARRVTGYQFGGTSPFGTRRTVPVCLEQSVCALPTLYVNAGARGLLMSMSPATLVALLEPMFVSVAASPAAAAAQNET